MDINFLLLLATRSGTHKIRMSGNPSKPISDWAIQAWLVAHITADDLPGGSLAAPPPNFHVDIYPLQALEPSNLNGVLPLPQNTRFEMLESCPVLIGVCSDVDAEPPTLVRAAILAFQAQHDKDVQTFLQQCATRQQLLRLQPPNPCQQMRQTSGFVHRWLLRQPGVKEESLTDWLLYEVSERLPFVIYRAFTRHQEARETGADWEWWIVCRKQHFRLRVQAKKVSPIDDNYPDVARTNRYGLQIDMLLDNARKANAIPLYALYSAATDRTMCDQEPRDHQEGVFLAGASRLYTDFIAGGRQRISATDLLALSNPFSCFTCCPLIREFPTTMMNFFEQFYSSEVRPDSDDPDNPRGVHTELPAYVTSLLEHGREGFPDWWEREFQSSIQDFNRILVYDYRTQRA